MPKEERRIPEPTTDSDFRSIFPGTPMYIVNAWKLFCVNDTELVAGNNICTIGFHVIKFPPVHREDNVRSLIGVPFSKRDHVINSPLTQSRLAFGGMS